MPPVMACPDQTLEVNRYDVNKLIGSLACLYGDFGLRSQFLKSWRLELTSPTSSHQVGRGPTE